MTSDDCLMLYAKLAGFRLAVLASRSCCDGDFSRELHDRLIDGLEAAIDRIWIILAWERRPLDGSDECTGYQFAAEIEIFGRITIDLLDELDIDQDTREYRINDGRWTSAVMVDDTGVHVDYPHLVPLGCDELGPLRRLSGPFERRPAWRSGPLASMRAKFGVFIRILPRTAFAARKQHKLRGGMSTTPQLIACPLPLTSETQSSWRGCQTVVIIPTISAWR